MLAFVEEVRDNGYAVSTSLVTVELIRHAPELAAVGFIPLHYHVFWFLKNHHLTFHVVTRKAQDHRYHAGIIADFTLYETLNLNWQIVASNYAANAILIFLMRLTLILTLLQDQP